LVSELQQTTIDALKIRKKVTESETKLDVIKSQAKDTMQGFLTEVDGFRIKQVLRIYEIRLYKIQKNGSCLIQSRIFRRNRDCKRQMLRSR
jgi:hypothetical protein